MIIACSLHIYQFFITTITTSSYVVSHYNPVIFYSHDKKLICFARSKQATQNIWWGSGEQSKHWKERVFCSIYLPQMLVFALFKFLIKSKSSGLSEMNFRNTSLVSMDSFFFANSIKDSLRSFDYIFLRYFNDT